MESNICGGRDGEMSECFSGNHNLLLIEDLAGLDIQKKNIPDICCVTNPPDHSAALEKAMETNICVN